MQYHTCFGLWTLGTIDVTQDISLDWQKTYLITGYLTLIDQSTHAHVYISNVCGYYGGDQVLCGLRDVDGENMDQNVTEVVSHANRVTIKLRASGGGSRIEVVIYEL